jgi:hypothetical protein
MEPLPLRPFFRGCIIATRGYDFRKGQGDLPQKIVDDAEHLLKDKARVHTMVGEFVIR